MEYFKMTAEFEQAVYDAIGDYGGDAHQKYESLRKIAKELDADAHDLFAAITEAGIPESGDGNAMFDADYYPAGPPAKRHTVKMTYEGRLLYQATRVRNKLNCCEIHADWDLLFKLVFEDGYDMEAFVREICEKNYSHDLAVPSRIEDDEDIEVYEFGSSITRDKFLHYLVRGYDFTFDKPIKDFISVSELTKIVNNMQKYGVHVTSSVILELNRLKFEESSA